MLRGVIETADDRLDDRVGQLGFRRCKLPRLRFGFWCRPQRPGGRRATLPGGGHVTLQFEVDVGVRRGADRHQRPQQRPAQLGVDCQPGQQLGPVENAAHRRDVLRRSRG